jgi:single-strand DNA-binding protein
MQGTTYPRMNRVFLTGTAQEEPELRYTPSGVSVCSFRVQVGRILRDRSGGSREVAAYLTVVAWQEAAQRMSRELRKGQAIYVEGYVSSRSFTTARGDKRTAIEIYAEQIQILGPFPEGEQPDQGGAEGTEETAASGGTHRRGAFRRQETPRPEQPGREHPAEPKREPDAAATETGETPRVSSADQVTDSHEATAAPSQETTESSGQQEDSGATESEDASRSTPSDEGEDTESQEDSTEAERQ